MRNGQKRMWTLWLGIFMFVLMGLFPPAGRYGQDFDFLLNAKHIGFGKLFVMWFIVAIITVGLIITFRGKEK